MPARPPERDRAPTAPTRRERFPLAARALHRTTLPAATSARDGVAMPAAVALPRTRNNWPLYVFLFLLPLQNVHVGYLPNLGGGVNFLNIGFAASLAAGLLMHGRLAPNEPVNRWVLAYAGYAIVSLFVGYRYVSDTGTHANLLKDHLIGMSLLYLVQVGVNDWGGVRRVVLAMLLPLPYIAKVTFAQHRSVSGWNYSDDLRIKGTFALLGANEFAAFCVTVAALLFALLIASGASRRWRIAFAGGFVVVLCGVLWAYSRTAYVALLLVVATVVLAWRGRWKLMLPLLLVAAFAPALLPASVVQRFDSTTVEADKRDESTELRFEFWAIAWDNFVGHPIVGTGFQSFRHPEINPHRMDTHNVYLRTLSEGGILGGIVFLGLLFSVLNTGRRELASARSGTWRYALALGLIGAWMGLVCGNLFGDRFTYYPVIAYFWALVGLVVKGRHLPPETAGAPAPRSRVRLRLAGLPR